MRKPDWTAWMVCPFTIPAGAAMATYEMRGITTGVWENALLELQIFTDTGTPALSLDNLSVVNDPLLIVSTTECIDPNAPLSLSLPTPTATPPALLPTALPFPTVDIGTPLPPTEAPGATPTSEAPLPLPTGRVFPTVDIGIGQPTATATPSATEAPPAPTALTLPVLATFDDGAPGWSATAGWTLADQAWTLTGAAAEETTDVGVGARPDDGGDAAAHVPIALYRSRRCQRAGQH